MHMTLKVKISLLEKDRMQFCHQFVCGLWDSKVRKDEEASLHRHIGFATTASSCAARVFP